MNTCQICNKDMNSRRALSMHIMRCHKDYNSKMYYDKFLKIDTDGICTICGKETKYKGLGDGYSKFCNRFCSVRNPETIKKKEKSYLLHYGVKNPMQSDIVKNKSKATCLSKYGVEYPITPDMIKKRKSTCLARYGFENPNQVDLIKEKSKTTTMMRYGVDSTNKLDSKKEKCKLTCLRKYNNEYYQSTNEFKRKQRQYHINRIQDQLCNGEPITPCIGKIERTCLNILQDNINYKIRRQRYVDGYFVDGYIQEKNIVIEFDESWHTKEKDKIRDDIRQRNIVDNLKCIFFRVAQKDWLSNEKQIIDNFKEVVGS